MGLRAHVAWLSLLLSFGCAESREPLASATGGAGAAGRVTVGANSGTGGLSNVWPPQPLLFPTLTDAGTDAEPAGEDEDASVSVDLDGPTTALVVFDRSGSMGMPWSGNDTRWMAANKALIAALGPVREQLTIGAIRFPLPDGCQVNGIDDDGQFAFEPGAAFIEHWMGRITIHDVGGSTPLEGAFSAADRAIDGAGTLLDRRFVVLVITDGEPTCDDDLETLERLPAGWLARGIETHVMGLPGSEAAAALLDRIAKAGGTERHQAIGTPDQLRSAVAAAL